MARGVRRGTARRDRAVRPAREGGNLIAKIHQLGGRVFGRILKAHGVDELNPAQGRIIYELWKEDGISQAELASRTRLDKSTLTLMLDRLENQGQLRRESDPADARRRIVSLTAGNRAMHAAYTRASKEMIGIFYRGMTDAEIDAFEATLQQVLGNLESSVLAPTGAGQDQRSATREEDDA